MLNFLTNPLLQFLLILYKFLGGNLGWALLAFTVILRAVLIPFTIPTLKSQKKIQAIKPELDALKAQYGHDKALLQQEQMKLYQKHKINPLGGCIPQILQFVVLIALYQVLLVFLHNQVHGEVINTMFFGFDLAKPDSTRILPIIAGLTQLVLALMILPGTEQHAIVPAAKKPTKKTKQIVKKEGDTLEMAETMQKQMVFVLPIVTTFAALQFPSGLAMYWVVTTVFSIAQQWVISGPGGLFTYVKKILPKKEQHD